jgi:antitoxin VapB
MRYSTVLNRNRGRIVRLPKSVAFLHGAHRVDIVKIGQNRAIVPQGHRWDNLFFIGPHASEDFMAEREQPADQARRQL